MTRKPAEPRQQPLSLRVEYVTSEVNAMAMSIISTAATWLSPVPEAAMTTGAIVQVFGLPPVVAALVAASLEAVGVNVNSHYLEALTFNDELEADMLRRHAKTPRFPPADAQRARTRVTWFYVITGAIVCLTALYEVFIEHGPLIKLLACLFPFASMIGTRTANERAAFRRKTAGLSLVATMVQAEAEGVADDLERLEAEAQAAKEERKRARDKEQESASEEQEAQAVLPDYASLDTTEAIKAFYGLHPQAPQAQAAQVIGVSRARVGQVLQALEQGGAIKRNGSGVEILA